MIYTRFGTPVTIIADCGEQKPAYLRFASRLLKVRSTESGKERFQFEFTLHATGGWPEIEQAYKDVPKVALSKKELKQASMEAE